MSSRAADVVICGAGIMGISAAYQLAVVRGVKNIVIIEELPPLTLTSDKSTECYRNWWPGPGDAMVRLMNRSIHLMEGMAGQSNNIFKLNHRGYLYITTESNGIDRLRAAAKEASAHGAGDVREHETAATYLPHEAESIEGPDGADLLTKHVLLKHFPYLGPDCHAALHVRRAGWLSAQTYGMWMLEQARSSGVELISARVNSVETARGAVSAVILSDGTQIKTNAFVNAAGPFLERIGKLLNVEIPVNNELHLKSSFNDTLGVVDRNAPLLVCADPQNLPWSNEERAALSEEAQTARLLDLLPSGAHTRPEGDAGAQSILVLWDIHNEIVDPVLPIPDDPLYTEVALRGLTRILPRMQEYVQRMPRPTVDGGYYTKTRENRPLAGPLPVAGSFVIGAAAGYGIMAAAGLGELLSAHVTGNQLPEYAAAFELERYEDPIYQTMLHNWGESWQL